jgi:hypothetical protein
MWPCVFLLPKNTQHFICFVIFYYVSICFVLVCDVSFVWILLGLFSLFSSLYLHIFILYLKYDSYLSFENQIPENECLYSV